MSKFLATLKSPVLWAGAAFFQVVEKFLFSNWDYLFYLTILIVLDFLTGVCKAWYHKRPITSKGFRDTVAKVTQYGSFLIATHILTTFPPIVENFPQAHIIGALAYNFLILIEIKSVYENIVEINDKFDFLKGIISKIHNLIKEKTNE